MRGKYKLIPGLNQLGVTVGTETKNGDQGWTIFKLRDDGGTQWMVQVGGETFFAPASVTICLRGESEFRTLIESLRYAADALERLEKGEKSDDEEEESVLIEFDPDNRWVREQR